jgi:hypothetical protein
VIISGLQSCPHWPDTDVYMSRPQTRRDDLMILRLLRPSDRGCEERFYRSLWVPTPRHSNARNL